MEVCDRFLTCYPGIENLSSATPSHDWVRNKAAYTDMDIRIHNGLRSHYGSTFRSITYIDQTFRFPELRIDDPVFSVNIGTDALFKLFLCHISMTAKSHDYRYLLRLFPICLKLSEKNRKNPCLRSGTRTIIDYDGNPFPFSDNLLKLPSPDRIINGILHNLLRIVCFRNKGRIHHPREIPVRYIKIYSLISVWYRYFHLYSPVT